MQSSKELGAFYTPHSVVRFLVDWAVGNASGIRVLDPSCGDGRFIESIPGAVGVDIDPDAFRIASERCQRQEIILSDFFEWADAADRRFDAIVGNPPFVRYQRFAGTYRARALKFCSDRGLRLSALSSSWAFFVVGAAQLLEKGGRLAFVVPAEIAYAVYARPVVRYLLDNFARVEIFAVKEKLFPHLSEDCWLLRASGFGHEGRELHLYMARRFEGKNTHWQLNVIYRKDLEITNYRLRPFLLPSEILTLYLHRSQSDSTVRLGDICSIGIGYVTGANDFFHLRPSDAEALRIDSRFLRTSVRSGRDLIYDDIDDSVVKRWMKADRPFLLLDLNGVSRLPEPVVRLLESEAGQRARNAYKCRTREPWYCVPDIRVPDAFLSVMATDAPRMVANSSGSVCTNSIHAVFLRNGANLSDLLASWPCPLTQLSCEVEGHSLGGGMLKLEPSEARNVIVDLNPQRGHTEADELLRAGVEYMRAWRSNGKA